MLKLASSPEISLKSTEIWTSSSASSSTLLHTLFRAFHSSTWPLPPQLLLQGAEHPYAALSCRSLPQRSHELWGSLAEFFFFNLWPMEIRHSVGLRHPLVQGIVTVCSSSLLGGFYSPASPTSAMTPLRCGFPRVERKGLTPFAWRTVTKRESSFFWIFWNSEYRQRFPLNILKLGSSPEISLNSTEIWRSRKYWFCVLKFRCILLPGFCSSALSSPRHCQTPSTCQRSLYRLLLLCIAASTMHRYICIATSASASKA